MGRGGSQGAFFLAGGMREELSRLQALDYWKVDRKGEPLKAQGVYELIEEGIYTGAVRAESSRNFVERVGAVRSLLRLSRNQTDAGLCRCSKTREQWPRIRRRSTRSSRCSLWRLRGSSCGESPSG